MSKRNTPRVRRRRVDSDGSSEHYTNHVGASIGQTAFARTPEVTPIGDLHQALACERHSLRVFVQVGAKALPCIACAREGRSPTASERRIHRHHGKRLSDPSGGRSA